MSEDPDCLIEITYDASLDQKFRFTRRPHRSEYHDLIHLKDNGDLKIEAPRHLRGHRFVICFALPDHYSSGGFSGIKIWKKGRAKPNEYRTRNGRIAGTPFKLHVHHDGETGKITKLKLDDVYAGHGSFQYNFGLVVAGNDFIESHDPEILNTGPVGQPC